MLGAWLREVTPRNPSNFLTFAPDELASNRLQDILEVTGRRLADPRSTPATIDSPATAASIEVLSEHICQGLLEGYLLTGRHGVFTCYEAFIHIVDSMFNQHAKWLEACNARRLAATDRQPELPAVVARLAPGPQRQHATRTRASSTW